MDGAKSPQNSLSGELAQRQQAQCGSDQSGAGGIEISASHFRFRPSKRGADDAECHRVMARRLVVFNRAKKISRQSVRGKGLAQIRCDAQYLSSHLAAGVAQFARRLHGVEAVVDDDALLHSRRRARTEPLFREASAATASVGATEPCRYESRKRSTPLGVANRSIRGVGFETEGMCIRARGEQAVAELQKAEESLTVHAGCPFRSAGTRRCIFPSARRFGRAIGSWPNRPARAAFRLRPPEENADCRLRRRSGSPLAGRAA